MEAKIETYPLIPVRNTVVYPTTSLFLVIGREKSIAALHMSQKMGGKVVIVAQKPEGNQDDIGPENLYRVATLCQIRKVSGTDKTGYQILVSGLDRFKIENISSIDHFFQTSGYKYPDKIEESVESLAIFNQLKHMSQDVLKLLPGTDISLNNLINQITRQDEITYLGASYLKLDMVQMQKLLEESDIKEKMKLLVSWFKREKEVLLLEKDIKDKVGKSLTKAQRDVLLREQLNTIKSELGESEESIGLEFIEKIKKANMPETVSKIALEEAERLRSIHSSSSDHQVIRNYLDCLCQMPWNKSSEEILNLDQSELILEKHHYGLKKIKKRILEYIAVNNLKGNLKGPIICLFGPPGVGKTSLGKSIAEAIGRDFVRTSLGGVRDESEIRGHRRTYIGSMPGRIIGSLKRVGTNNPVILLDEIDKLGANFSGDPASAMLEVLDPEQNNSFTDHYLDVPFDLSNVFFIATANRLDTIPAPLRDRMEMIELSSYTLDEKIHIGEEFIIPKSLEDHGIKKDEVTLDGSILESLIKQYTREAGVRDLKRVISSVSRGAAYEIVKGKSTPLLIDEKKVLEYLGPPKYMETQKLRKWTYGIAMGLAWTPVGGEVLYLESILMPGNGLLKLTGQLGDVMKESAQLALSYIRSHIYVLNQDFKYDQQDIHLHIPTGAIPKDGPSAGVAMLVALASLIMQKKVPEDYAMTGEITLSGSVLPVGGIKEKIIAAHRYGIKKVIIPKQNEKDLYEIPDTIKSQLEFLLIDSVDQVLDLVFEIRITNM